MESPVCPVCGAPIERVRCTTRDREYRCVLCLRSFTGPGKKGLTAEKWKAAVEGAAKKEFANEITARKFMATPPEDEPRVETLVIPPKGILQLSGGLSISNPGDGSGKGTEIVFAGPITAAEEERLNKAGVYPQAMIFVATCDDCGKKITGEGPTHFGPITNDGIEEWCDECDKKPKRNKRRRA